MYILCSIHTDVSSVRRRIVSALVDQKNDVQCYVAIRAPVDPWGYLLCSLCHLRPHQDPCLCVVYL